MAFLSIKNIKISSVAACVPQNIIENRNSPLFTDSERANVINTIGIERRHCAPNGMTSSDLCFEAAQKILDELTWSKSEIDALIFVTQTPDYRNPATSCILQDRLGLPVTCMALDVSLGCSGYIYGLSVISGIMAGGNIKKALLLVGDTTSLTSSPEDKSRILMFGDAGTATALEYSEGADEMYFHLATDGSGYKAIMTPDSGFRNRITPDSFRMEDFGDGIRRARVHSLLDGMEVFSFGIYRAPQTINELRRHFNLEIGDVDYFLFHQANLMLNEKIRQKIKIPLEKVPYNLKDFGNTSCASIPLLMVTNLRDELNSGNMTLILCAFGVGLSWGSIYLKTSKITCPALIEI